MSSEVALTIVIGIGCTLVGFRFISVLWSSDDENSAASIERDSMRFEIDRLRGEKARLERRIAVVEKANSELHAAITNAVDQSIVRSISVDGAPIQ